MTTRRAFLFVAATLLMTVAAATCSAQDAAPPHAKPATDAPPATSPAAPSPAGGDTADKAQAEELLKKAEARLAEVKSKLSFPLALPNDPDKLFGPPPKPEDNAHPLYRQAFAEMAALIGAGDNEKDDAAQKALRAEYEQLLITWGIEVSNPDDEESPKPQPRDVKRARQFLDRFQKCCQFRDRAVLRPSCRTDTKWSDGIETCLPDLAEFRQLMRLTLLESAVDLADGRTELAYGHVATVLRMARHVQQEPTLVASLVAVAMANSANEQLARALSAAPPDGKSAATLRPLLTLDAAKLLHASMIVEVNVANVSVERLASETADINELVKILRAPMPADGKKPVDPPSSPKRSPAAQVFLAGAQANYLVFMDALVRMAGLPVPRVVAELRKQEKTISKLSPATDPLTLMLVPSTARAAIVLHNCAASGRMAQIALDLAAFKKAKGEYPQTLAALPNADKLPVDPYCDKPFHYRRDAAGFTLWSVGADGDDDGGKTLDEMEDAGTYDDGNEGDAVFRVPPAPAKWR
jgi:hypothetical protein